MKVEGGLSDEHSETRVYTTPFNIYPASRLFNQELPDPHFNQNGNDAGPKTQDRSRDHRRALAVLTPPLRLHLLFELNILLQYFLLF